MSDKNQLIYLIKYNIYLYLIGRQKYDKFYFYIFL